MDELTKEEKEALNEYILWLGEELEKHDYAVRFYDPKESVKSQSFIEIFKGDTMLENYVASVEYKEKDNTIYVYNGYGNIEIDIADPNVISILQEFVQGNKTVIERLVDEGLPGFPRDENGAPIVPPTQGLQEFQDIMDVEIDPSNEITAIADQMGENGNTNS